MKTKKHHKRIFLDDIVEGNHRLSDIYHNMKLFEILGENEGFAKGYFAKVESNHPLIELDTFCLLEIFINLESCQIISLDRKFCGELVQNLKISTLPVSLIDFSEVQHYAIVGFREDQDGILFGVDRERKLFVDDILSGYNLFSIIQLDESKTILDAVKDGHGKLEKNETISQEEKEYQILNSLFCLNLLILIQHNLLEFLPIKGINQNLGPKKRKKLGKRFSNFEIFEPTKFDVMGLRKGHFRNQRYGKKWSKSKVIFIPPTKVIYGKSD